MEESGEIDQSLIKLPSQDLTAPKKEMDLATAHVIAQKIASTSLKTITATTTLAEITEYSQEQVEAAAKALTVDIMDNPDPGTVISERSHGESERVKVAEKQTDQGSLRLTYSPTYGKSYWTYGRHLGQVIELELHEREYPQSMLLRSSIPAGETPELREGYTFGFQDYRDGEDDALEVTLHDVIELQNNTVPQSEVRGRLINQVLFKGARWVFANLDQWKQNPTTAITPELAKTNPNVPQIKNQAPAKANNVSIPPPNIPSLE